MKDKPTLKEYMKYSGGRYARTDDGRYYKITTYPKIIMISIVLAVLLVSPVFIVMFSDIPWSHEISKDWMILCLFAALFAPALYYHFGRFERIEEGSEQYQKVLAMPNMRYMRIFSIGVIIFLIAVNSLSGYSLAYLRSLMDTPKAELQIHIDKMDDSIKLYTDEDDTTIKVPGELNGEVAIHLYTWHTPATPQLALDGKVLKVRDAHQSSPFWVDQHYFYQSGTYAINTRYIHDGSVLSLTCGKWRYDWVFKVEP